MNEGVRAKEPGCTTGALVLPTTLSAVGILLLTHFCQGCPKSSKTYQITNMAGGQPLVFFNLGGQLRAWQSVAFQLVLRPRTTYARSSPALAHTAGEGGVLAMIRQWAMEAAPCRIRANCIAPGFIQTAATAAHLAADLGFEQRVPTKNMIKRLARQKT